MTSSRSRRPAGPAPAAALLAALVASIVAPVPSGAQDDTVLEEPVGQPTLILPQELAPPPEPGTEPAAGQVLEVPEDEGGGLVQTAPSEFEVEPVADIGREAWGTLGDDAGGLGLAMWAGTHRAVVEALLPRLPVPVGSPVATDLARRLLLTQAVPPDGAGEANLVAARVARLAALGQVPAGLAASGDPAIDAALARARADAALARGDDAGACAEAAAALQVSDELYWQEFQVYCQLTAGRAEAAQLAFAVLDEGGAPISPGYRALAGALVRGEDAALDSLPGATVLELALAARAGVDVPADAADTSDPQALMAIARSRPEPGALELAAAERAEAVGALSAESLASLYGSASLAAEDLANPISAADTLEAPLARALLHQAVARQAVPTAQAEVVAAGLASAAAQGAVVHGSYARVAGPWLAGLAPTPEFLWFAPQAMRALLAADRAAAAARWWSLVETRALTDTAAAEATRMFWPLARLAGLTLLDEDVGVRFAAWAQDAEPARADALAALLVALGDPAAPVVLAGALAPQAPVEPAAEDTVGDAAAEAGAASAIAPLAAAEPAPAALAVQLLEAAAAGRRGEAVLIGLVVLGTGPATAPLADAAAVVRALRTVGLEAEARRLAIETALAHGL